MSTFLPNGFRNLPVSAAASVSLFTIPVFVSVLGMKPLFFLAMDPFITEWKQWWRFLLVQLQFQNQSEVLLSTALASIKLKNIERIYGSDRLLKQIVLLFLYNLCAILAIAFFGYRIFNYNIFFPAGPFGVLFGLLYAYHMNTPVNYQVQLNFNSVFNIQPFGRDVTLGLNDKFDIYILSILLMFNEGVPTLIVTSLGYIIGCLYYNNLLPITDSSIKFQWIKSDTVLALEEDEQADDPSEPPRTMLQQLATPFSGR